MAAAGRRTSLVSLAGATVEDVPGKSDAILLSVPLDKLHCTRFNPRRNFGTEQELREFGEKLKKEQLQPAVVVSRAAYLKLWPEEADRVGIASYVIANGERRYRASLLVGRNVLEVVHKDDVAASRADFLDAVQSENNDRQDLDPIERAIAIETMVTELGGADQVAAYYGKTKGWVSQQRKLLRLKPVLQNMVSARLMPVRVARDIAGLPEHAQEEAWAAEIERREQEKEAVAALRARTGNQPGEPVQQAPVQVARFTAVNQNGDRLGHQPGPAPDRFTAVNQPSAAPSPPNAPAEAEPRVPEARPAPQQPHEDPAPETSTELDRFPYENGAAAARHLVLRMPPEELGRLAEILNEHRASLVPGTA